MNGICPNCQTLVKFNNAMPFTRVNCPECETKLIVPKIFKNFQLIEIEEEFSIFIKYKAYDLNSDQEIFITIMNKKFSGYRECLQYCKVEARKLSSLLHPGILPILEYDEYDGTFYYTEPFINNYKLAEYDCQVLGEFDTDSVLNVFKIVANIIKIAHERKIIHHNICLDNILIDTDGNIKLQNFLPSRVIYSYESTNEEKSSTSPLFISPEKVVKGTEDEKGDIFSLGVALYYILSGKYPFDGEDNDEIIYTRVKKKDLNFTSKMIDNPYKRPTSLDVIRSDIPVEYSELVDKMLRPVSIHRPTANKFILQMENIAKELTLQTSKNFNESFSDVLFPTGASAVSKLGKAIEGNKLALHYQPILNLKTNTVSGFEAFLRWPNDKDKSIFPESFIPKIDNSEDIEKLGIWVIDNACKQLSKWKNEGFDNLYMIVNISPEQIKEDKFKELFGAIIKKYDIDRNYIIPEISKLSSYDKTDLSIENYEDFLTYFHSRISLNEITTRYKTLQSKFGKLKLHSLIIDSAYLENMQESEESLQRFKKVIAFANSASLDTVAEKIETKEQADIMKKAGCTRAQGFYFGKPDTAEEATKLLQQ